MKKISQPTVRAIPMPDIGVDDQMRIIREWEAIESEVESAIALLQESQRDVEAFDASLLTSLVPVLDQGRDGFAAVSADDQPEPPRT